MRRSTESRRYLRLSAITFLLFNQKILKLYFFFLIHTFKEATTTIFDYFFFDYFDLVPLFLVQRFMIHAQCKSYQNCDNRRIYRNIHQRCMREPWRLGRDSIDIVENRM